MPSDEGANGQGAPPDPASTQLRTIRAAPPDTDAPTRGQKGSSGDGAADTWLQNGCRSHEDAAQVDALEERLGGAAFFARFVVMTEACRTRESGTHATG